MTIGNGYVGLAKETTFGEAVAPSTFLPAKSFETETDPQNYYPEEIKQNRGRTKGIPMGLAHNFSTELDAEPNTLGHFLLAALGKVTSAVVSGGTTAYEHNFTPANTLPSYTFEGNDSVMTRRNSGAKCDTLTLSIEAGDEGALKIESEWICQSVKTTETVSTPNWTDEKPFVFYQAQVTKGGSTTNAFKSLEIEISNNLKDDQYGITQSREVQEIEEGIREVSGSVEMRFKNKTEYEAFMSGEEDSLSISFEANVIEDSTKEALTFELPKIMYDDFSVPMGGPDEPVIASLEFAALWDVTSGFDIKATLVNAVQSY